MSLYKTLNNFYWHYFIIIHSYPILFYIIIQNQNFNPFFLYYEVIAARLTTIIFSHHRPADGRITGPNMLVEII